MPILKNNLFLLLFTTLVSACQSTRVFRMETFQNQNGDLHIIHTNSDHVRQRCLFLNAEKENNWRHQYFIYVLNDKNEVLEIMKSTHTDGDFCRSQVHSIEKVLREEPQAKICVRDEVKKIHGPETQKELISFGPLGEHKVTYEGLTFDSICNSKKCVGNNSAWIDTCPGFAKQ